MENASQTIPVRIHRSNDRITLSAPMPGLAPDDIVVTIAENRVTVRGEEHSPGQHDLDFILNEWSIGPYSREVTLPEAVRGDLANATYGNGVLVLSMPTAAAGQQAGQVSFRLERVSPTHGERVAHSGKEIHSRTTGEHMKKHQ
jgi:HSP20 family protein